MNGMTRTTALLLLLALLLSLAGCGAPPAPAAESAASPAETEPEETAAVYEILVRDEDGEPVPGVGLQFCSDTECILGTTDENGAARFEKEAGSYTVHVLKAPEGFAADETEYAAAAAPERLTIVLEAEPEVVEYPELGFRFTIPKSFRGSNACFCVYKGWMDEGFLRFEAMYYAVTPEDWEAYSAYCEAYSAALQQGEEPPEAPDPAWTSDRNCAPLFEVFSIKGGHGEKEIRAALRANGELDPDDFAWFEQIGSDGEYRFFAAQFDTVERQSDDYREAMGAFFDDYMKLYRDREGIAGGLSMSAPREEKKLSVGDRISFETSDLDGNPVGSAELFAGSRITMINLWATWCPPCRAELPELEELAKEFEAQGCRIIGVCHDAVGEEQCSLAKDILAENGVSYLNLAAPENVDEVFLPNAFPTSFFVDGEGRILGIVVGAYLNGYRSTLSEALGMLG